MRLFNYVIETGFGRNVGQEEKIEFTLSAADMALTGSIVCVCMTLRDDTANPGSGRFQGGYNIYQSKNSSKFTSDGRGLVVSGNLSATPPMNVKVDGYTQHRTRTDVIALGPAIFEG